MNRWREERARRENRPDHLLENFHVNLPWVDKFCNISHDI
jgi:hypothetical protein